MGVSREVEKHVTKMEERARQEEELFTRVPLSKMERKRDKFMKKSRNGYENYLFWALIIAESIKKSVEFVKILYTAFPSPSLAVNMNC